MGPSYGETESSLHLCGFLQELHLTPSHLPLTLAFDFPTIRKLTTFLQDAQGQPALSTEPNRETGAIESSFRNVGVQCITTTLADSSQHQQFLQTAVIGCDAAVEIPLARWDVNAYCEYNDTVFVTHHGSFLAEIDLFDAAHFEMSLAEAAVIDPGQRLVLQCACEVLMPQAEAPNQSAGCAVVVAQFQNDWSLLMESCSGISPSSHASAAVCALVALRLRGFKDSTTPFRHNLVCRHCGCTARFDPIRVGFADSWLPL